MTDRRRDLIEAIGSGRAIGHEELATLRDIPRREPREWLESSDCDEIAPRPRAVADLEAELSAREALAKAAAEALLGASEALLEQVRLLEGAGGSMEEKEQVHRPPAHRLGGMLRVLLGARAFDRVFGQTIADAHQEWLEAHIGSDLAEAKRVKFRAVFYLLWAAVLYVVARVGALVSDLRKLSGPKS